MNTPPAAEQPPGEPLAELAEPAEQSDGDPQPDPGGRAEKKPKRGNKKHRSGTPATNALAEAGIPYALHPYQHDGDGDYGLEAAAKLNVDPDRVFKTLLAEVDGDLVVAVVPVSGRLNLKALAAAVGGKRAVMADPAVAERITGYRVGGISPLGQKRQLPTVIDDSSLRFASVLVSAGRRGLDLEVMPQRLVDVLRARLAPIAA